MSFFVRLLSAFSDLSKFWAEYIYKYTHMSLYIYLLSRLVSSRLILSHPSIFLFSSHPASQSQLDSTPQSWSLLYLEYSLFLFIRRGTESSILQYTILYYVSWCFALEVAAAAAAAAVIIIIIIITTTTTKTKILGAGAGRERERRARSKRKLKNMYVCMYIQYIVYEYLSPSLIFPSLIWQYPNLSDSLDERKIVRK